jgi:hypothetical protein
MNPTEKRHSRKGKLQERLVYPSKWGRLYESHESSPVDINAGIMRMRT